MLKKFFCFLAIIYYGCCFNLTHLYSNDQKIMIAVDAYFGPPNTPPIITNLFVTETSGNISILYDLVDNESNLCTVALEYSEAGSAIWYPASISGTITDITPDTGLEIIWNSADDLPDINGEFVSLRLRAYDGILWGDWDTLDDVFVINTYVIFQISFLNVFDPHINNMGSVVWRGDLYDNTIHIASDIYLFNTVTTIQLTDFNYFAASPKINDNGAIIWAASDGEGGLHSTGTDTEIYLYDAQTISRLTDNNYDDVTPALNNADTVVWSGWDGADFEIFMYDGVSVQQITSNATDDINPQINDSTTVVWMGWDGADYEIFMYDNTSIVQLTDNSLPDNDARINNSGDIAWSGFDGSDWEIYLYRNGIISQITDNVIDDIQPQLSSSGTVVWAGGSASNKDIYYYDGVSIVLAASSATNDTQPQINGSDVIVWSGSDGASANIYIFDGTTLTNLTHDQYLNITPQINDKSYIVWNRWNGTFWEIMLAYPRTPYSIEIISISEAASFIGLTWTMNPPYAPFTIYWSADLNIWDSINGSALDDIYINSDGTKTWYDTGSDPDMGGLAPSAVEKRLYKIMIDE